MFIINVSRLCIDILIFKDYTHKHTVRHKIHYNSLTSYTYHSCYCSKHAPSTPFPSEMRGVAAVLRCGRVHGVDL